MLDTGAFLFLENFSSSVIALLFKNFKWRKMQLDRADRNCNDALSVNNRPRTKLADACNFTKCSGKCFNQSKKSCLFQIANLNYRSKIQFSDQNSFFLISAAELASNYKLLIVFLFAASYRKSGFLQRP